MLSPWQESAQTQHVADQALRHAATELRERVRGTDTSDRRCPLVPLIVGGDDLTVLVDGRFAVAFVHDHLQRFGERTSTELVKDVLAAALRMTGDQGVFAGTRAVRSPGHP